MRAPSLSHCSLLLLTASFVCVLSCVRPCVCAAAVRAERHDPFVQARVLRPRTSCSVCHVGIADDGSLLHHSVPLDWRRTLENVTDSDLRPVLYPPWPPAAELAVHAAAAVDAAAVQVLVATPRGQETVRVIAFL